MAAEPTPSTGAGDPAARPTVLYIVGAGRSGSTVLERVLGGFPGFVNVGELVEVFRQIAPRDERCGCGELFSDCTFWQAVGKRDFDDWDPALVARHAALQRQVARQRYLPKLWAPRLGSDAFRASLSSYLDVQYRLYRAVLEESGSQVVVDASKAIAPLVALRNEERVDLRVLHLVRDVRGVSHSWAKADVARPHATSGDKGTMASFPVWRTAARWTRMEAQAAAVARAITPSVTLRYEDLVADPEQATHGALQALGLGHAVAGAQHIDGHVVTLPASHGISGNPSRFSTGEVVLRADEAWRTGMGRRDRLTATVIGLPSLLANRYLTSGSAR